MLAMSQHPAFGSVDVPPLVPWITLLPRLLTGNALWAIHVISALVCAATILLGGLMARLLGGTEIDGQRDFAARDWNERAGKNHEKQSELCITCS